MLYECIGGTREFRSPLVGNIRSTGSCSGRWAGAARRQDACSARVGFPLTPRRPRTPRRNAQRLSNSLRYCGLDVDGPGMPGSTSAEPDSRARSLFAGLPLMFEPNQGQGNLDASDPRAKFVARGSGYGLFLGSEGAILSMLSQDRSTLGDSKRQSRPRRVDSIQMKLVGANPNATVTGADLLPGKSNYFIGNDPAKWRTGVPQFARVRYDARLSRHRSGFLREPGTTGI